MQLNYDHLTNEFATGKVEIFIFNPSTKISPSDSEVYCINILPFSLNKI